MELYFQVRGSKGDIYDITIEKTPRGPLIDCSCPAGINGTYCKHRFALIDGDASIIIEGEDDLPKLRSMVAGTELEAALLRMRNLEAEAETIKRKLAAAKKAVGREMTGFR